MKQFFINIQNAIYGRDYQTHFADKTFWQAVRYIATILVIQSIVLGIVWSAVLAPAVKYFYDREAVTSFVDRFMPAPTEIKITKGVVSTNDGLPYIIQLPHDTDEVMAEHEDVLPAKVENFLVVDPTITDNAYERFVEYKTVILVTQNQVVAYKDTDSNRVEQTSLSTIDNVVISQQTIMQFYETLRSFMHWLILGGVVLLFVATFIFGLIGKLIFALIVTGFVALVAHIRKIDLSFAQMYVIALYALTLALLIDIFVSALAPIIVLFVGGFGFWLSLLVTVGVLFINLRAKTATVATPTTL